MEVLSGESLATRSDTWFAFVTADAPPNSDRCIRFKVNSDSVEYLNPFDPSSITPETTVFCKTDYVHRLAAYFVQVGIRSPFILLTGQSDYPITEDLFRAVTRFMSVRWFAVNACTPSVMPMPLGLGPSLYRECAHSGFRRTSGRRLLYVNHRVETNPQIRAKLYPMFEGKPWATVRRPFSGQGSARFLAELCEHKFMLCPRGNGIDTHRMWEALCCEVVPVVERHYAHSSLDGLLPILFVDRFEDITETLLQETWRAYRDRSWTWSALKTEWWLDHIRAHAG
jgi:hypothetical protein